MKVAPEYCEDLVEVDPLNSLSFDDYSTHQLYFIRLFYIKGRLRFETVGKFRVFLCILRPTIALDLVRICLVVVKHV